MIFAVVSPILWSRMSEADEQNYGITPWLGIGLQNCFISAAFIGLAFNALFVLVIFKGKAWRADSRATYWRYVETSLRPAH